MSEVLFVFHNVYTLGFQVKWRALNLKKQFLKGNNKNSKSGY